MRRVDAARLVLLAALWGASFLFMRIMAPVLGPVIAADSRTLVASAALAIYFHLHGFDWELGKWWREYAIVGVTNTALPFILFSYAAMHIPAGLSAVLNSTTPMWGALLAALVLGERLTALRCAGLVLGVAGVALVTRPTTGASYPLSAIAAGLGAGFSYAATGVYLKRRAQGASSRGMALGTQLSAGIILLPLIPLSPPLAPVTPAVAGSVVAAGLLSGALAYVLYFRLIADIGPIRSLTVTYLIPLFGVLFGAVFLGEALGPWTLGGAVLVILGTVLVLRK